MIILALDTTTRSGSAAVVRDGVVQAVRGGDSDLSYGQRLPAELTLVLNEAGVRIDEIDLFAVAAGPGSFTGLRVGIATIQGLAMAHGKQVVAVSALDALARAAANASHPTAAWMDAQRGEVFAALYSSDGTTEMVPPVSAAPETVLHTWAGIAATADMIFIGDGAVKHRTLLEREVGARTLIVDAPALAGLIGQIAAGNLGRATLPHAIIPIYVRKSDAELARARRAARG